MRKGLSMAINATVKWVLALIILLILVALVFFMRDRSISLMLSNITVPT